jgi:hypothetical protein
MLHAPIDETLPQEALCAPGGSDVLIYDTFNAAACAAPSAGSFLLVGGNDAPAAVEPAREAEGESSSSRVPQSGRRKRRRRERSVKNRDDAESQRITHIAVERNRRRQMNECLAALRSLMPDSYVRRVRTFILVRPAFLLLMSSICCAVIGPFLLMCAFFMHLFQFKRNKCFSAKVWDSFDINCSRPTVALICSQSKRS